MKAAVNSSSVTADVYAIGRVMCSQRRHAYFWLKQFLWKMVHISLICAISSPFNLSHNTTMTFQEKIKGVGGDASYETKARVLREQLEAKIPASLRLPPAIFEDLPLDVTHIPEACGLLTPAELAITELDATAVCQKIAAGELTAVEAVTAFGKRAAIAHQLTACLVDFFLDEGIKQAQQLDEYFKKEGKVIGPLHGLPISVKVSTTLKS
jgi:amidase